MRITILLVQATVITPIAFLTSVPTAEEGRARVVDLVVNITGDQPAYMAPDVQSFSVTISNNGPETATNVELVVEHPIAETPFEDSATLAARRRATACQRGNRRLEIGQARVEIIGHALAQDLSAMQIGLKGFAVTA